MNDNDPTEILPTKGDPPPPPPPPDATPEEESTDAEGVRTPDRPSKRPARRSVPSRPEQDLTIIDRGPRAQVMSWGPFQGCAVTK